MSGPVSSTTVPLELKPPVAFVEHVCAVAIFLADGTAETQVLHRGRREDCEAVAGMTPAVTYAGAKPVRHAKIVVRSAAWWDALVEDVSSDAG